MLFDINISKLYALNSKLLAMWMVLHNLIT